MLLHIDVVDVEALLCWTFKDQMIAAVDKEIELRGDDANALSDAQRAERTATILGDLLMSEREEELLIEHGEAKGIVLARRTNADPRALLGLSSDLAGP